MLWVFLVLALLAALVELHTGTFYLAAVAAAALLTALIGIWLSGDWLILVFLGLCAVLMAAVMLFRRGWNRGKSLPDFDIGQIVSVQGVTQPGNQLLVLYRGTHWHAVMDGDAVLGPGDTAIIARKTDKLLHLTAPAKAAPTNI
jgi:membrane protein implicated in regulation of membrane protease activity